MIILSIAFFFLFYRVSDAVLRNMCMLMSMMMMMMLLVLLRHVTVTTLSGFKITKLLVSGIRQMRSVLRWIFFYTRLTVIYFLWSPGQLGWFTSYILILSRMSKKKTGIMRRKRFLQKGAGGSFCLSESVNCKTLGRLVMIINGFFRCIRFVSDLIDANTSVRTELYHQLGTLLKSAMVCSRMTPTYRYYVRKQSSDTFIIMYRVGKLIR